MSDKKYIETIGVNEVIRKPPVAGNANDPESMIQLEGQMMGRLGDRPRSLFMILLMWVSFLGPMWIVGFVYVCLGIGEMAWWLRIIVALGLLGMVVITNFPVYQALRVKYSR